MNGDGILLFFERWGFLCSDRRGFLTTLATLAALGIVATLSERVRLLALLLVSLILLALVLLLLFLRRSNDDRKKNRTSFWIGVSKANERAHSNSHAAGFDALGSFFGLVKQ